jgi:hypothetical protein
VTAEAARPRSGDGGSSIVHLLGAQESVAETASIERGRAEAIVCEVTQAVWRWREFADTAGVVPKQIDMIADVHRLDLVSARA